MMANVGVALVAAHGKHKKSSLPVGGHKGGPYIAKLKTYKIMETQSIIPERKLIPSKWVSIHYEVIKKNFENDMRDNPNDFDEKNRPTLAIP